RLNKRIEILTRLGKKFLNRLHLATIRILAFFSAGKAARNEQIPQLLETPILPAKRLLGRRRPLDWKRDMRPVECREAQSSFLTVRDGQASECAAMEGAFERHDEAAVPVP